jgi:hypothetical protein
LSNIGAPSGKESQATAGFTPAAQSAERSPAEFSASPGQC